MRCNRTLLFIAIGVVSHACGADSIDTTGRDGASEQNMSAMATNEDGARVFVVDASDYDRWQRFKFCTLPTDCANLVDEDSGASWDLALRRYVIRLNGGVSGTGTVVGQHRTELDFREVTQAPDGGWGTDIEDDEGLVFHDWYEYDQEAHVLTPKPGVWFVRADGGMRYYALVIESYYNDAGDSGFFQIRWKSVTAPAAEIPLDPGRGTLPANNDSPHGSNDSASDNSANSTTSTVEFGCYSGPPNHRCDCTKTEGACVAADGEWTAECACADSTGEGGTP
ncbi:MAG: HmuY family protein [Myxococcota bacterium]|nr:HmuY family protein [Myxococcota bacterium]